jgi:hypothetical protein
MIALGNLRAALSVARTASPRAMTAPPSNYFATLMLGRDRL